MTAGLSPESYLDHLRRSSDQLLATEGSSIDLPVAACPGWGLGRLVGHVGMVHRWAAAMMREDPPVYIAPADLERAPRDDTVWAWFGAGVPGLVEMLEGDLDARTFTWAGEQDRRWWLRRAAHETVVHAWDAQQAVGSTSTIDPALAVDGINEIFEVYYPNRFDAEAFGGAGETVHLHCTDVEGEWLVRYDPTAVHVGHEHAKGDVAVRGAAADLLLLLWGRQDPSACEVFGDRGLLDRVLTAGSF